eukprot:6195620-Pleurochrysis_carterae.AAC.6
MNGKIVERPQHMLMRVAIGIHKEDLDSAIQTYELMSQKWFTHATPTMFNAGTPCPQMSSCFLLSMKDDSIEGIFDTLSLCARISKSAGGIGISVHDVRAKGSYIKGSGGTSNGLVPMLRVFDNTARYVDQGGGKRKGAFAIYLEPWHADILAFLDLKKNHGKEEGRARDLFYALWVPDLFMKRVEVRRPHARARQRIRLTSTTESAHARDGVPTQMRTWLATAETHASCSRPPLRALPPGCAPSPTMAICCAASQPPHTPLSCRHARASP